MKVHIIYQKKQKEMSIFYLYLKGAKIYHTHKMKRTLSERLILKYIDSDLI
jgi:hypothetical protein